MLMKGYLCLSSTGKDYKEVISNRIKLFSVILLLGIITLTGGIIVTVKDFSDLPDFIQGLYTGLGGGLTFVSALQIIRNKRLLKSEQKIRRVQIEEQDERNILIQRKAMQSAGLVIIFGSYITMMIACIFSMAVFWTLFIVCMLYFGFYIFFTVYFKRV